MSRRTQNRGALWKWSSDRRAFPGVSVGERQSPRKFVILCVRILQNKRRWLSFLLCGLIVMGAVWEFGASPSPYELANDIHESGIVYPGNLAALNLPTKKKPVGETLQSMRSDITVETSGELLGGKAFGVPDMILENRNDLGDLYDSNMMRQCRTSLFETDGFICMTDRSWALSKMNYRAQQRKQKDPTSLKWGWRSYFQSNFEPNFSCLFERRIGNDSAKARWVCDPMRIRNMNKTCVIYTVGLDNNSFDFEEEIHQILPRCEIHVFDQNAQGLEIPSFVYFHEFGKDSNDEKFIPSLASLRRTLSHNAPDVVIEILKIASKFKNESRSIVEGQLQGVRQLLIEIRSSKRISDASSMNLFFEGMDHAGWVIFHKEFNIADPSLHSIHYSFLNLRPSQLEPSSNISMDINAFAESEVRLDSADEVEKETSGLVHSAFSRACETSMRESNGFFCIRDTLWNEVKRNYLIQQKRQKQPWQPGNRRLFFYANYQPNFSCQFERRLGNKGDGGKWVCDPHAIQENPTKKKCLVYSIGSRDVFDFENDVSRILPECEIHTFDHTVEEPHTPAHVHFHRIGLGARDTGNLRTLASIREMLGHSSSKFTIEILKVDIEGSESNIFDARMIQQDLKDVRQLLIEIHGRILGQNQRREPADFFFDELDRNGWVIFHKEPNILGCAGLCIEYSFLNLKTEA